MIDLEMESIEQFHSLIDVFGFADFELLLDSGFQQGAIEFLFGETAIIGWISLVNIVDVSYTRLVQSVLLVLVAAVQNRGGEIIGYFPFDDVVEHLVVIHPEEVAQVETGAFALYAVLLSHLLYEEVAFRLLVLLTHVDHQNQLIKADLLTSTLQYFRQEFVLLMLLGW